MTPIAAPTNALLVNYSHLLAKYVGYIDFISTHSRILFDFVYFLDMILLYVPQLVKRSP